MIWHLDYEIDKQKWQQLFWDHIQEGQWHWSVPKLRYMYWYQLFSGPGKEWFDEASLRVERDLNIVGMNNYPRFSYQLANTRLRPHIDEDKIVAININLMDSAPTIHLLGEPYQYECALINVGEVEHSVEPEPTDRLILKYCLRHPLEEIMERLDKVGLLQR